MAQAGSTSVPGLGEAHTGSRDPQCRAGDRGWCGIGPRAVCGMAGAIPPSRSEMYPPPQDTADVTPAMLSKDVPFPQLPSHWTLSDAGETGLLGAPRHSSFQPPYPLPHLKARLSPNAPLGHLFFSFCLSSWTHPDCSLMHICPDGSQFPLLEARAPAQLPLPRVPPPSLFLRRVLICISPQMLPPPEDPSQELPVSWHQLSPGTQRLSLGRSPHSLVQDPYSHGLAAPDSLGEAVPPAVCSGLEGPALAQPRATPLVKVRLEVSGGPALPVLLAPALGTPVWGFTGLLSPEHLLLCLLARSPTC